MAFYSNPKIVTDGLTLLLDAGSENSNPGSDIIHDLSGNDNDGTMYTGKCLDFDGSSGHVQLTDNGLGTFDNQSFTLSLWIKPDSRTGDHTLFSYDYTSHDSPYYAVHLRQKNDGTLFFSWNDGSQYRHLGNSSDIIPTTGVWYHIVCLYTSGRQEIWVNNELKHSSSRTDTITFYNQEVWLGKANYSAFYDGKMSDVKMFNTALTSTQIAELYNTPNKVLPTGITPSQLVGYWPLSEGDGTIAHDGSDNQNHGTLSGTTIPTWVNGETDIPQLGGKGFNSPMVFAESDSNMVSIGGQDTLEEFSYSVWFKKTSGDSDRRHLSSGVGSLTYCTVTNKISWYDGTSYKDGTNVSLADGKWHHAVFLKYLNEDIKVYVDGILDLDDTSATYTNGKLNNISGHTGRYFNGLITEVALWNTTLDSTQIAELATTDSNGLPLPPDATTIQSSNLVGYWRNDGDTTWEDRSGNGNNGTVNGTPDTIYLTEGKYKNRDSQGFNISDTSGWMGFDSGDYVNCGSESNLDITEDITVCLWVKTSSEATYQDLIRKAVGYPGYGFLLITSLGKLEYYVMNNTTTHDRGSIDITDDTWHYLSLTLQNNDATIYVDTVLDNTLSTSGLGSTAGTDLIVGTVNNNFNGKIALPKIYNRALTQAEITQNFNAQRNRFGI